MNENKEAIKFKIAHAVMEWYRLRGIVKKTKVDRGSPYCGCGGDSSCYFGWRNEQITLDEMLECEKAARYYTITQFLWNTSRKAAGARKKLNHLIKLYDKT